MSFAGSRRSERIGVLPVVLVVAAVFLMVPAWNASAGPLPSTANSGATTALAPASVANGPPVGVLNTSQSNASGNGTFYLTSSLPNPSPAAETCVAGLCYNTSNDVAVNVTSTGLLAVAYTTLTDRSPCGVLTRYSVSNIAFLTSANDGQSWSPVQYLGNSVCTGKSLGYPDAWEPSLTSLSNGTLVLVYVEYNLTAGALPPLTPSTWPPTESRLVLTESYDGGVTWTLPTVLNISNPASAPPGVQFTPAHPSVTAFGNTIYVTWMSLSFVDSSGSIGFITSSTGGSTWSPTIPVSTGPYAFDSMNPQITVAPSGELFIAYVSNISFTGFVCGADGCVGYDYGVYQGNIWIADSASNGTVFAYSEVAEGIPVDSPGWDSVVNPTSFGPFQTPSPQVAYSAVNDTLIVAFTGGQAANGTSYCVDPTAECLTGGLYYYTSFDNGTTFSTGNIGNVVFNPSDIDPSSENTNATDSITSLALGVEPNGEVDLEAGFYNGSLCTATVCGAQTEVVFSTWNNGTSFTSPATVVSSTYTPDAYAWNGEEGAVALPNGVPQLYWVSDSCPTWRTAACGPYPSSAAPVAQVQVSSYYNGTGATVTFSAVGLPADVNWSVSVLGNDRNGSGTTTLSVGDVPTGVPIFFQIPNVNLTETHYIAQLGTLSPNSPLIASVGSNPVTVHFKEYVPVTVSYTVPLFSGYPCTVEECPTFYPSCVPPNPDGGEIFLACYTLYFTTGAPGGQVWSAIGQPVTLGISSLPLISQASTAALCPNGPAGYYTECYGNWYNLTLLGWAGAGPGSVSTTTTSLSFTPEGPVTETASFLVTGACVYINEVLNGASVYYYNPGCVVYTAPVTIDEQGLPSGATWGISMTDGPTFAVNDLSTAPNPIDIASVPLGLVDFEAWNVPAANSSWVWEGVSNYGTELFVPLAGPIVVTYTLVNISTMFVPVQVTTLGLPSDLVGNITLQDTTIGGSANAYTVPTGGLSTELPAGTYVVNASPILTTSGVRYDPVAVYADVGLINDANQSAVAPATVLFGGPVALKIDYAASYFVQVSAGPGGTASPASQWVTAGSSLTLRATPNTGYDFLGWTGTGPGATSAAQAPLTQVVILPGGPVTELASFVLQPAPSYTVHVLPTGIPVGQTYSMTLGNTTYSGSGTLTIRGIAGGTYPIAFPAIASTSGSLTRYVLTSVGATSGLSPSGTSLTVATNLTVSPVYLAQLFVTIAVAGNGTPSLPAGSYWETANSTLSIIATPDRGYVLEDWVGSFNGGPSTVISNSTTLELTLTESVSLVARFVPAPPTLTAKFSYSLRETGLPVGASWQFALSGTSGAAGVTATLQASGLNGTYTLYVPVLYLTSGIRYVPSLTENASVAVTSNVTATVTFTEQVLVTVATSGNGSASGGGWYAAGTAVLLAASTAPAGTTFVGWQGSGAGSYTGANASQSITPLGPVTETATYVASSSTTTSSGASVSALDYAALAIIVVVLAAVGLFEGLILARKRRPPTRPTLPSGQVEGEFVDQSTGPK